MQGKYIRTRVEDHVGHIEIGKPKANTYDLEMMREFALAIDDLRFDDTARVIIVESWVPASSAPARTSRC